MGQRGQIIYQKKKSFDFVVKNPHFQISRHFFKLLALFPFANYFLFFLQRNKISLIIEQIQPCQLLNLNIFFSFWEIYLFLVVIILIIITTVFCTSYAGLTAKIYNMTVSFKQLILIFQFLNFGRIDEHLIF